MSLPDEASALARSYDAIPDESLPISETHPANLAVQGALFGLAPPDPQRCRVLEVGCAAGGNLIPMAYRLPGSEFVGIELSASQAAAGNALIETLDLQNVRIEQADILDLGDIGRFDYVITHGLYSWTPPAVREKLFALCGEALSPHGIAYVSYNTLPGWRQRGMLRDMLLYGVRAAGGPEERLGLAYATLDRLEAALADETDPVAGQLRGEIARLRGKHPSYLYHEYLAEVNEPVLFSTFMAQAAGHGLQYLCEVELHTMFADGLGETGAALVDRFDDLIEQEQYMDFLRRRVFRQTLLCRAAGTPRAGEVDHLLGELVGLYLRQYVGLRSQAEHFPPVRAERPRATALARAGNRRPRACGDRAAHAARSRCLRDAARQLPRRIMHDVRARRSVGARHRRGAATRRNAARRCGRRAPGGDGEQRTVAGGVRAPRGARAPGLKAGRFGQVSRRGTAACPA